VVRLKASKLNKGDAMKCIICERRPAGQDGVCANCASKVGAENRRRKPDEPFRFATYQGHVVGFFPNGNGTLKPRLLNRNPDKLPKSKTLDLNRYIEGFTRERVKGLKACVLKLANA
jgi:hypothetical protein